MLPTLGLFIGIIAANPMAPAPRTAEKPSHLLIDQQIQRHYPEELKKIATRSSDAEFLRRVTLDLHGTIPTATEVRSFLADRSLNKRTTLINRLLSAPGYERRMAQYFDVMLMERRPDSKVSRSAWEEYLRMSFAENKPYDQLVREILSADGVDAKSRGQAKFLLDRNLQPDPVTRDIGRLFLGRDMQCAQCHDHPLVKDYKQSEYFGILAYFNRSFLFPNDKAENAVIAEKAEGEVSFMSVFDHSKTQKSLTPRLPNSKVLDEPKIAKGKEYKVAPKNGVRPEPTYSRRAQLARELTSPGQKAFARTAVNRLWNMMFGRGLIDPVEMDHSGNPPSHPELLEQLTQRFIDSRYDIKELIRSIAQSETYQLSSELPGSMTDLPEDRYLVAPLKPLSPEQLAMAVLQATGQTDVARQALGKKFTPKALDDKLASHLQAFRRAFSGAPGEPESYSATLDQTLFLKHGNTLRSLIAPRTGNLADRLKNLADQAAMTDELFLSVLGRPASEDEKKEIRELLSSTADTDTARSELIWALIASTEFRFNH